MNFFGWITSSPFLVDEEGVPTYLGMLLMLVWGGMMFCLMMAAFIGMIVGVMWGLSFIASVYSAGAPAWVLLACGFLIVLIACMLHAIRSASGK